MAGLVKQNVKVRLFGDVSVFVNEAAGLLGNELSRGGGPRLVVVPGGMTPRPIYEKVAKGKPAAKNTVVALSDERLAAGDPELVNFRFVQPMAAALDIPSDRLLHPEVHVPKEESASHYDAALKNFIRRGWRVSLALLGLGNDGHTAGLFDIETAGLDDGRNAIAVSRRDGLDGVTVTRTLLKSSHAVIFLVRGAAKREIVARMESEPDSVPAYRAVHGVPIIEVWFCDV